MTDRTPLDSPKPETFALRRRTLGPRSVVLGSNEVDLPSYNAGYEDGTSAERRSLLARCEAAEKQRDRLAEALRAITDAVAMYGLGHSSITILRGANAIARAALSEVQP